LLQKFTCFLSEIFYEKNETKGGRTPISRYSYTEEEGKEEGRERERETERTMERERVRERKAGRMRKRMRERGALPLLLLEEYL